MTEIHSAMVHPKLLCQKAGGLTLPNTLQVSKEGYEVTTFVSTRKVAPSAGLDVYRE